MKKQNQIEYNLIWSIILFLVLGGANRISAQILPPAYPSPAEDISRTIDSSKLTVQLAFLSSCSSNVVTVSFPPGVNYIPGTVSKINGSASYTITELSITNLRKPTFTVAGVTGAGSISFHLYRKVDCGDSLSGKDTVGVVGSCGSVLENNGTLNTYRFRSPSLSVNTPTPGSGVAKLSIFNRTIELYNGGNGKTDTVYFFKRYLNSSIKSIDTTFKVTANGITFLPYKVLGDTCFYKFFGDTIFNGNHLFSNGEVINIVEKVQVLTCDPQTLFGAAWGKDEQNICKWIGGIGYTVIDGGVPKLTKLIRKKLNHIDKCTPYDVQFKAVNGGVGNDSAAGMFNVRLEHGFVWNSRSRVQPFNGNILSLTNGRLDSNVAVSTFSNVGNMVSMNFKDLFITDPDGPGGLSDLDNDGFFDDLPAGDTLTYTLKYTWNCNTSCGYNKVYYEGARLLYTTMCGDSALTTPIRAERVIYESSFSGSAYAPANINGGSPFRLSLNQGHHVNLFSETTSQGRYEWRFVLPAGYSVSGTGAATYGNDTVGYTKVGDTIFIKSKDNILENAAIDLVYNCGTGSSQTLAYFLTKIDNDSTSCRCQGQLVCGSLTLTSYCSSPCLRGPVNYVPKVRRTKNSLGWTDNTMQFRQSDTAISDYDLSRALYLDTIEIRGVAYQRSTVNNLYLDLSLGKASGTINKLESLGIDVKIIRSGVEYSYSVSNSSDSSIGSTQVLHWDISSGIAALPGGTMLPGDTIITNSTYVVATNKGLPQNDIQSGGRFYHFSYINGVREYCNSPVPEMYLLGTNALDGRNTFNTEGCEEISLGGSGSNIARRFNSAGRLYTNEFRPMMYVDSVVILNPEGYDLIKVTNSFGGGTMTVDTIIGDEYTYRNPGTWKPIGLTRTNAYGGRIIYTVRPRCNTPDTAVHGIKIYVKDFYYAHVDRDSYPSGHQYILGQGSENTASSADFKKQNVYFKSNEKPILALQNLSGEVKGIKKSEYWDILVRNDGLSSAGKIWLSVERPNGSNITVDSVINLTTGTKAVKHNFDIANGWFEFSDKIISAERQTARVYFGFGNCEKDSAIIRAGWNCHEFPDPDPVNDNAACQTTSIMGYVVPKKSQIQVTVLEQPANGRSINLCTLDSMQILVNSAMEGNVVNPKLQVFTPPGVFIFNPVKVEYPVGSGVLRNATPVIIPGGFEIDLTGSVGPGINGIPGLLANGSSPGRQLRIILYFLATCDHISGNNLSFKIRGESPCGGPAVGDNQLTSTEGIFINGANATGAIAMSIDIPNDTIKCSVATQKVKIINLPLLAPVKKGDVVNIWLPQGTKYKGNFNVVRNCPSCTITSSPGLGGTTHLKIALDSGLSQNVPIEYTFDIGISDYGNCGPDVIRAKAQRLIPSLMCFSRVCSSSSVFIGEAEQNVVVVRPEFDFVGYHADYDALTFNPPYKYSYKGQIKNVSDFKSGDSITLKTFFDKNKNGLFDPTIDSFIKRVVITGPLAAGSSANFADSFWSSTTKPSVDRPLFSIIDSSNGNCLCKPLEVSSFLNALPVEFLHIKARLISTSSASVTWSTASEVNAQKFEVYRSIDGIRYIKVGQVEANGTSNSIKSYEFKDDVTEIESGVIHYKIKQIDFSGEFKWSKFVTVQKTAINGTQLSVYPNPASSHLNIDVVSNGSAIIEFTLFNSQGVIVKTFKLRAANGKGSANISVVDLPSGIYNLVGFGYSTKVVFQH
jgi:hypothetical protein